MTRKFLNIVKISCEQLIELNIYFPMMRQKVSNTRPEKKLQTQFRSAKSGFYMGSAICSSGLDTVVEMYEKNIAERNQGLLALVQVKSINNFETKKSIIKIIHISVHPHTLQIPH